jgi:hypothetical protein
MDWANCVTFTFGLTPSAAHLYPEVCENPTVSATVYDMFDTGARLIQKYGIARTLTVTSFIHERRSRRGSVSRV